MFFYSTEFFDRATRSYRLFSFCLLALRERKERSLHEPEFGHFCRIPWLGVSSFSFYGFGEKTFTRLPAVYSSTYLALRVLYFHSSSIFSLHRTSRVRDRFLARFAASLAVSSLAHPTVTRVSASMRHRSRTALYFSLFTLCERCEKVRRSRGN